MIREFVTDRGDHIIAGREGRFVIVSIKPLWSETASVVLSDAEATDLGQTLRELGDSARVLGTPKP